MKMSDPKTPRSKSHSRSSDGGKSGKVLRAVLSCIFSFMVALSLFAASTACIVRGVLSEKYTISCIAPSYYDGLKESLEKDAWDYTIPTGIEPSVTKDIFDTATMKSDMENYIGSTFKIRKYTIDTSSQGAVLKERVYDFLKSEGTPTEPVNPADSEVELDEESVKAYNDAVEATNTAVDEYVDEIMELYRKSIKIAALDYIVKVGNEYQKYFPFLMIISVLFGLINGFFCMKVHRLPHRGLRYLVYAFGAGFLMTFTIPFIIYLNGFYNRLNIAPAYFKEFMIAYVKGALAMFMVVSQIWLLIAIILGVLVAILRKKRLRSEARPEEKGVSAEDDASLIIK